jgi:hypothetical protein
MPHTPRLARRSLLAAGAAALASLAPRAARPAVASRPLRAPAFRLPLLAGGMFDSTAFTGRAAVLLFWAPW